MGTAGAKTLRPDKAIGFLNRGNQVQLYVVREVGKGRGRSQGGGSRKLLRYFMGHASTSSLKFRMSPMGS